MLLCDSLNPFQGKRKKEKTLFYELSKIEDSLSFGELQMALNGHVVFCIFLNGKKLHFEMNRVFVKEGDLYSLFEHYLCYQLVYV